MKELVPCKYRNTWVVRVLVTGIWWELALALEAKKAFLGVLVALLVVNKFFKNLVQTSIC